MIICTFENGNQNSLRHATVGCVVVKDGKILLEKRSEGLLEAGKWCFPGGYADRDETTEETGIRETLEETGWVVKNLQLMRVNDNPDRPHEDRQNIDFIYIAEAVEKTGEGDWETEDIQWFPLDKLPPIDQIAFDHYDSIKLYLDHQEKSLSLPIVGRLKKAN